MTTVDEFAGAPPRILCIGANEESRQVLEGLIGIDARIVGLVTRPPSAAAEISDFADLRELCSDHGIPCVDTDDINAAETIAQMEALAPDYAFILGWSQLLGPDALRVAKGYAVGSHPSLLPAGRGRAPIPWAILLGETVGGVSLFRMVRGADAGPILLQRPFAIPGRIDAAGLYELATANLREAFMELYRQLSRDTAVETIQDEGSASYRARRVRADGHIDFSRPRVMVDRLVRAVTRPYPGAYTYWRGMRISVWGSDPEEVPAYVGVPGQVLMVRDGRLLVHAGDGPLWLHDFTRDGEALDARTFPVGDTFGYRVEDELYELRREVEALKARLRDPQR